MRIKIKNRKGHDLYFYVKDVGTRVIIYYNRKYLYCYDLYYDFYFYNSIWSQVKIRYIEGKRFNESRIYYVCG